MPSLIRTLVSLLLVAGGASGAVASPVLVPAKAAPASGSSFSTWDRATLKVPPDVQILNGSAPGSLDIRVDGTADLSSTLLVEQQRADGSFAPVRDLDLGSMKLVTSCNQRVGTCVRVEKPGLRPVPWSGMSCASQCNRTCDKNLRLKGLFRFVITSCDGSSRFLGDVFELPNAD